MENPTNQIIFSNRLFYLNRILIFLLLYLAFGVLFSNAAVTVDNSSSYGEFLISGVSSLTFSHTVGNGTSRALYVGVSTANPTLGTFPGNRVSSLTYNGQALIRIGSQISPNLNNGVEIFRFINPPSGTSNVVINIAATSATYAFASAVSFYGVDQTSLEGNFVSASGTSDNPGVAVTGSAVGDLIFDAVSSTFGAGFFVQGTNQIVCTDEINKNT